MGCDIHFYVEKKTRGKWIPADKWSPPDPDELDEDESATAEVRYQDLFYSGRNYSLFAILANVRNGYGFAGCDTGDGFNIISEPRNLPKDVSKPIKKLADHWGCDGHSHSWLTLKELLDFNWDQTTKQRGYVSMEQFKIFQKKGVPDTWCGGIMGSGIKIVSIAQMKKAAKEKRPAGSPELYCQVEWGVTYRECVCKFIDETMPKLKAVAKNPENVRIVFWFDN